MKRKDAIQYVGPCELSATDGEAEDALANFGELCAFVGVERLVHVDECVRIPAPDGPLWVRPGDWVVRGDGGEFYTVQADLFEDRGTGREES